jgi:hypothetical protein
MIENESLTGLNFVLNDFPWLVGNKDI